MHCLIILVLVCSVVTAGVAKQTIRDAEGNALELSQETYQRLEQHFGFGAELHIDPWERGPGWIGSIYSVASESKGPVYLFVAPEVSAVLDSKESVSIFYRQNPNEVTPEALSTMIAIFLLRPGGYILDSKSQAEEARHLERFLVSRADTGSLLALKNAASASPLLTRDDKGSWRLAFHMVSRDGALTKVSAVGRLEPFLIMDASQETIAPANSYQWPFLGQNRAEPNPVGTTNAGRSARFPSDVGFPAALILTEGNL